MSTSVRRWSGAAAFLVLVCCMPPDLVYQRPPAPAPEPTPPPQTVQPSGSAMAAAALAAVTVVIPGEDTATAVSALPSARWPHVNQPDVDLHFETLGADSAQPLAAALRVPDPSPDDRERLRASFVRAKNLAGLAQAPFSYEPPERQARLRGVALHAALDAYRDLLGSVAWATREGCWLSACPDKGWFLLFDALLLEQAGDLSDAAAAYKQVLAETVTTMAGTHPLWVESNGQANGVVHLGLALIAEGSNARHASVLQEYDQVLGSLNCNGWSQGIDCARLRQFVLDHVKTTSPDMLAELDRLQQERTRREAAEAALLSIWTPVEQQGDDIAKTMWMADYEESQLGRMPSMQRDVITKQIQGTRRRVAAMVQQGLCPAKKAFLSKAGAAEFNKRAAAHCKENPPSGSAQGRYYAGAETGEVALTAQCQRALASSCP
jgi:hypothetical protein